MKKNNSGMSLLETVVTLSVAVIVGAVVFPPLFKSVAQMYKTLDVNNMFGTMPGIQQSMKTLFDRGRAIKFTNSGTAKPGYLIADKGAFVLKTDLRSCKDFNPATSNNQENITYKVVSCCGANENIQAETPEKVILDVESGCSSRGLSILNYGIKYNSSSGADEFIRLSANCIPDVQKMSIFQTGMDPVNGSPLYSIELTSWKSTTEPIEEPAEYEKGRALIFGSLGYSGSSLLTDCQNVSSQ